MVCMGMTVSSGTASNSKKRCVWFPWIIWPGGEAGNYVRDKRGYRSFTKYPRLNCSFEYLCKNVNKADETATLKKRTWQSGVTIIYICSYQQKPCRPCNTLDCVYEASGHIRRATWCSLGDSGPTRHEKLASYNARTHTWTAVHQRDVENIQLSSQVSDAAREVNDAWVLENRGGLINRIGSDC